MIAFPTHGGTSWQSAASSWMDPSTRNQMTKRRIKDVMMHFLINLDVEQNERCVAQPFVGKEFYGWHFCDKGQRAGGHGLTMWWFETSKSSTKSRPHKFIWKESQRNCCPLSLSLPACREEIQHLRSFCNSRISIGTIVTKSVMTCWKSILKIKESLKRLKWSRNVMLMKAIIVGSYWRSYS